MPNLKYDASRDIPLFAREARSLKPNQIVEMVLNKRNEKIDGHSVNMWLSRHPDFKAQLEKEIYGGLPTEEQVVDASIFLNGNFQQVRSVKDWILYMQTRRHKGKSLHPQYLVIQVGILRQVCQRFKKHPDRLSFRDAQEIFMEMEKTGQDTCCFRRALKDFLKSKGAPEWEKIGVGKPRGFGTFKDLYAEKTVIEQMLEWVKTQNPIVYAADQLMYHNGLRLNAVLTAQTKDFKYTESWGWITVLEKFREVKTFKVVPMVRDLIVQQVNGRVGKIFLTDDATMAKINGEALKKFCPEIIKAYGGHINPNHFWRHMCAQHLKKITKGNTKACSALMQCTEQSFNESYGGATETETEAWENEFLPQL